MAGRLFELERCYANVGKYKTTKNEPYFFILSFCELPRRLDLFET